MVWQYLFLIRWYDNILTWLNQIWKMERLGVVSYEKVHSLYQHFFANPTPAHLMRLKWHDHSTLLIAYCLFLNFVPDSFDPHNTNKEGNSNFLECNWVWIVVVGGYVCHFVHEIEQGWGIDLVDWLVIPRNKQLNFWLWSITRLTIHKNSIKQWLTMPVTKLALRMEKYTSSK